MAAWIGALIGAAANQISWGVGLKKRNDELLRQERQAKAAYGLEREYGQAVYGLQRGEALESLGIQRNRLAEAFGADVEGFNLGLEGQALGGHAARIGLSDGLGMAAAAQGASGTRGGGAAEKQAEFQEGMFGRQADLQGRGNGKAVADMSRQYGGAFADIDREAGSWNEGGWRYEANRMGLEYADARHKMQMDQFKNAYKDLNSPLGAAMGFLTAGFQGAGQGMSMGIGAEKFKESGGFGGGGAAAGGVGDDWSGTWGSQGDAFHELFARKGGLDSAWREYSPYQGPGSIPIAPRPRGLTAAEAEYFAGGGRGIK